MLRTRDDSVFGKTCLVSGSGNVAQYVVENVNRLGGRVVTLSDSSGFIHDPAGIDADKLEWVKHLKNVRRGRIAEYAEKYDAQYRPGERPWAVPGAELAFPSAIQNELDANDAADLVHNGVTLVAEGANMPCRPDAVARFLDAGILYGPGKAANAGGVAVCGLEMAQNAGFTTWPRDTVDARLLEIMTSIHRSCIEAAEEYGCPGQLRERRQHRRLPQGGRRHGRPRGALEDAREDV